MSSFAIKAAAAALGVGLVVSVAAAPAASAGVAGKKCAVSGQVKQAKGQFHVCTKNSAGDLKWGKGTTVSKSTVSVMVHDGWAKAAKKKDTTMSAAFGMLHNMGSSSVTIVAAKTKYAKAVQMHEMVMKDGAMVMQEKPGGFTIPAAGSLELKPGGNHLMFIGLKKNIKVGKFVPITLYTSTGSKVTIKVLAKNFSGANEEYPGGDHGGMSGMAVSER